MSIPKSSPFPEVATVSAASQAPNSGTTWVPIPDGGALHVSASDPRAQGKVNSKEAALKASRELAQRAYLEHQKKVRQREIEEEEAEEQVIQQWVNAEGSPGFWENNDDSQHDRQLIAIISFALKWSRHAGSCSEQVDMARKKITQLREKSVWNVRSVLLRDAERYLWGRAGLYVFANDCGPFTNGLAPFIDPVYQTGKGIGMLANPTLGTTWFQTRPNMPFSPLGGNFWYNLGLSHYYRYDATSKDPAGALGAREPTIGDVLSQRGFAPADAARAEKGEIGVEY